MQELRKLRGKSVLVSGGNAENDLLELYPELFSYIVLCKKLDCILRKKFRLYEAFKTLI